ncbi:MAG: hypothetical protein JNL93_12725 [Pelomonas sp.]|nr:hypothetical protein [Roseateles sp.]
MSARPLGFQHLLMRMPRWFVEHARKTEARGRRRRAAQALRFELAYARPAPAPASSAAAAQPQPWPDTVAFWQHH